MVESSQKKKKKKYQYVAENHCFVAYRVFLYSHVGRGKYHLYFLPPEDRISGVDVTHLLTCHTPRVLNF